MSVMSIKKVFRKEPFENFFDFPAIVASNINEPLFYTHELNGHLLLSGFAQGIFAWNAPEEPILWWSPATRCVIPSDAVHVSRSLAKLLRKSPYRITFDQNIMAVVEKCATVHGESWIDVRMKSAILDLINMEAIHSIEIWEENTLIGGLYGVALERVFCAESMFSLRPSASKIALVYLGEVLSLLGIEIIEVQFMTAHLKSMGAMEISRQQYFQYLTDFPTQHAYNWGRLREKIS